MKKRIGLEPVELNDAELAAVAGGNPFQNAYIQSADNSTDVNQVNFGADSDSVNNSYYISIS